MIRRTLKRMGAGMIKASFSDKRIMALLEVCLVTSLLVLAAWLFEAFLNWFAFWGWCFKALLMIAALLAIALPRRSFRAYGFLPNLRFSLKWGSIFTAIFVLPAAASIALSAVFDAIRPAGLSPLGIALNAVFYMIFVGLIEEVYFRGYVQSRLNEVFERRWRRLIFRAWRVDYGMGLLLASAIFALVHVVNYWNPLTSRWDPIWWMPVHILGCFAFGCVAGALREASSDVYVPASLHGGVMTAYAFLSIYASELVLNVDIFVSWFAFFYVLAFFFREAELWRENEAKGEPSGPSL